MSNDSKNRLGDKLAAKEKAEEDHFFAASDRAKLETIKHSKEIADTPKGRCPRDGQPLAEQESEGVTIDLCSECGGIWLDKGELEQIAERRGENWLTKWVRSILDA
jgi:hypothetical protein